jgi:hypothetical protein
LCPDADFNATWEAYKLGFGHHTCDFYLGNEYMHQLTRQGNYILNVKVSWPGPGNSNLPVQYMGFAVDSESDNYTAHYSSMNLKSSASDGLGTDGFEGRAFCTPDRDCGGCALAAVSGWWFGPTCSPESNLNGPYGVWASVMYPSAPRLKWNIAGNIEDLIGTYMMVKATSYY